MKNILILLLQKTMIKPSTIEIETHFKTISYAFKNIIFYKEFYHHFIDVLADGFCTTG